MNEHPKPNPDLKALDRLIGTWKQSGELDGETTFEWAEGGFFLIQHGRLHALNTDAGLYGGSNVGNLGGVDAEPVPWHDQEHSAELTLPPLGVVWLVPERG